MGAEGLHGRRAVLGGGEGGEQQVRLDVAPAAVIQRTAGAQEDRQVPVSGEPGLAVVQVEVPGGQRGSVFLPGQGADLNWNAGGAEGIGQIFGHRDLEAVFAVYQQRERAGCRIAAGGQGSGEAVDGIAFIQLRGIQAGNRRYRELGGGAMAGEEGADYVAAVKAHAQRFPESGIVQRGLGSVDADILENGGVCILVADVSRGADGIGAGQVGGNELHVMGGEAVEHGIPVRGLC